jgi:MFS family permease
LNGRVAAALDLATAVRRNTALLSAVLAVNSTVLQLSAAVSSLTFVLVTGFDRLLGAGPAIFLTASALTALPAGRAMDRLGRVPVIATGFVLGACGCTLNGLGARAGSTAMVIAGMALLGSSGAVALLIRTAAGDMYPPERRARGIALVLSGAVVGAILGPTVFTPLFAGKEIAASSLVVPWLAAAGLCLVAMSLALFVRPDPRRIGELLATGDAPAEPSAPLREIIRRPGVIPALLAGLASFGVMASVMNLTGYVVVRHHHHSQSSVFPIVGAHVLGMYALIFVVGALVDRIGRTPAIGGGLALMAVSCTGLLVFTGVPATAVLLFGLGLGWNLSFVAATAQLADRSSAAERGKLLGLNDLMAALLAAALSLLGGYALEAVGVAALSLGAAALVALPMLWIMRPALRSAVPAAPSHGP